MSKESLGIYVHIPFCAKKCNYCDFNSGVFSDFVKTDYVNALLRDIESKASLFNDYIVDTIFIGGGTPSVLPSKEIGRILECLRSFYSFSNDCEISTEANPGTVNIDKLKDYKVFGINRISFGLQSVVDEELAILGRIHKFDDFKKCFEEARLARFENINVDLMSAIPNQTLETYKKGLNVIKELNPEHISAYSLIIEEGTPFYDMDLNLPNEETEREMVHLIPKILGDEYHQYEISNYAKKGFECKHNIKYWERKPYLGFGISAAGMINDFIKDESKNISFDLRYKNTADIYKYINDSFSGDDLYKEDNVIFDEYELLDVDEKISEYLMLGLRMNKGVTTSDFKKLFSKNLLDEYKEVINKHVSEGLLECDSERIKLTQKGRDLCNYVLVDFVNN